MLKQCITYLFALILASILLYSLTALAIAPINPEVASNSVLEGIIGKLAWCESRNNPQVYVKDDGGSPSAGILQFKYGTFRGYWKELINNDVEEQDIKNLWQDPEAQKQLATAMIAKDRKNLRHWLNCSTSQGLI